MKRSQRISTAVLASLLVAGSALAQANANGEAGGQATSDVTASQTGATMETAAHANATATADAAKLRERIEQKAAKTSAKARDKAESQLEATATEIEKTVVAQGETKVATRLAAEFGGTTESMIEAHQELGTSWGALTIANTIASNSKTEVTVEQLLNWKVDGMGLGELAAGLGLQLGSVVSSVKAEGRVAQGLAKADGKVEPMHGEGARVGVGANAGLHAGVGNGAGNANAAAGANAGVGIKIGR